MFQSTLSFKPLILILASQCIFCLLPAQDTKVKLLVTSDVHAQIFPQNIVNDHITLPSLAALSHLIEQERKNNPNVILLDNGDMLQGTPAGYFANYVQKADQNLFSRLYNYMNYDAVTVGNHDIECGPVVYDRVRSEMEMPWLAANILSTKTGLPYFQPYTIIERQGLKIAVLGLTTPSIPNWLPEKLWIDMAFENLYDAAQNWVSIIQKTEQPDAIIGLFHSGWGVQIYMSELGPPENMSLYIASHIPGFDVIFTGHDHIKRDTLIVNYQSGKVVLILGPGPFAQHLGVVDLVFQKNKNGRFNITDREGYFIKSNPSSVDENYMKVFEKDVMEILNYANQPVGILENTLFSGDALFGSAPFTDLIHQHQLSLTGADISFTAPLAFNATLEKGRLDIKDFFKLYRYENYLYTMEMSGAEIKNYLEYSYYLWTGKMNAASDLMLNYSKPQHSSETLKLKYPYYSFDSAAGIIYEVDLTQAAYQKVNIIEFEDGRPFQLDKMYKVALNSYRGSGGGGHLSKSLKIPRTEFANRILSVSENEIRTEFIQYFKAAGVVNCTARNNWKFVPEEWVRSATARETEMLFGK